MGTKVLPLALGVGAAWLGAHLFLSSRTGKRLVARARSAVEARTPRGELSPSPPSDPVDEASWESFPASDPPAIGRSETPRSPRSAE